MVVPVVGVVVVVCMLAGVEVVVVVVGIVLLVVCCGRGAGCVQLCPQTVGSKMVLTQ